MEPLDDRELDALLREWSAPEAPAPLERRLVRNRSRRWWQWLLTGSIRVPAPVAAMVLAAILALLVFNNVARSSRHAEGAAFRPVKEMHVRVIRSSYEDNR